MTSRDPKRSGFVTSIGVEPNISTKSRDLVAEHCK